MRKASATLVQLITVAVNAYVAELQARLSDYVSEGDDVNDEDSSAYLCVQDIAYNTKCVQEFAQHKSLKQFVQAVTQQDTMPREECFAYIVQAGALSWDDINY